MEIKKSLTEYPNMMNIKRGRITAVMTIFLSVLAIYASLVGILDKNIYGDAVLAGSMNEFLRVGSIAQDIMTTLLSIVLIGLSTVFLKSLKYKAFIALIGLTTGFFYNFGLYVIQGQYTSIYVVYLAIFSLSIYSILFGLLSFEREAWDAIRISSAMRKSISVFLIAIILILGPGWLLKMGPDIAKHVPGDTYAVYILDLCIVFPALSIIISKLLGNKPFNAVLGGVALFKVMTVCLSWGFAQWFGPVYKALPLDIPMTVIPTVLTLVSLALIILYMNSISIRQPHI